jgi:hypothetical protein
MLHPDFLPSPELAHLAATKLAEIDRAMTLAGGFPYSLESHRRSLARYIATQDGGLLGMFLAESLDAIDGDIRSAERAAAAKAAHERRAA